MRGAGEDVTIFIYIFFIGFNDLQLLNTLALKPVSIINNLMTLKIIICLRYSALYRHS